MISADLGPLDNRVRFERKVEGGDFDSAGRSVWQPVLTVWASLLDQLPSRSEQTAEVVNIAARPTRVRMRWQPGLSADMRIVVSVSHPQGDPPPADDPDLRVMEIVAGPAEIGRRVGLEFMAANYSTAGNAA